jgi:hypothetical protein
MEFYVTYQPSRAPLRWSVCRLNGSEIVDRMQFESGEDLRSYIEGKRPKISLRAHWALH